MNNKTTIPKTDKIKEIHMTKKITKTDSEQYITVQIKYSNMTVEERSEEHTSELQSH